MSSLLSYLATTNMRLVRRHQQPKTTASLPDPNLQEEEDVQALASTNSVVNESHNETMWSGDKTKKKGPYHRYDGDLQLTIARLIGAVRLTDTARKLSNELGHNASMNTLKSTQHNYAEIKHPSNPMKIKSLPKGAQGRPTQVHGLALGFHSKEDGVLKLHRLMEDHADRDTLRTCVFIQ